MSDKLLGIFDRKTLSEPGIAMNRIIEDKFLSTLFTDELALVRGAITIPNPKAILEIGAAGGNTKHVWPEVRTTDVRISPGVDQVMSAEKIDAQDASLDVLFGLDALHHARNPRKHFQELQRTLRPGGNAIYIEPNWNKFSMFCFKVLLKYLHPEPYNTKQKDWEIDSEDPMMGNQAQAYNIFVRDRAKFEKEFPDLKVEILEPLKGVAFLLSGGVHTRLPIPSSIILAIYRRENSSPRWLSAFSLGRLIRITKS
jgi:SAM-dependent methyltransferase